MNVVVTGGGTIAPIDEVRHVANASTGRFAAEVAEACLDRGASVWYVHAPSALLPIDRQARLDLDAPDPAAELDRLRRLGERWRSVSDRLHLVPVPGGQVAAYRESLRAALTERPIDVAFLAMAVSDYEPIAAAGKLASEAPARTIELRRTPKVIREVKDWAPSVYLVGFKLLAGAPASDLIAAAEASGRASRADLTVANDLRLYRLGRHTLHLVRPGHPVETLGPVGPVAPALVDRVLAWARERVRG